MRSLLLSDYCLSAWCTWSSVTSVTNDSTTLWVHTILQRLSNNIRVHNSCVLTVLTLLFLCFALMFLMSATMCVYKVWREKNIVYMKAKKKQNKNKQKQSEDCPIGRSAEALTAENQVHRSKLLTHHYIRHSPVSKIKLTGHFVRYTEWIARLL